MQKGLLFVALFALSLLDSSIMVPNIESHNSCCVAQARLLSFEPRYPKPDFRVWDVTSFIISLLLVVFILGIAIKLLKRD